MNASPEFSKYGPGYLKDPRWDEVYKESAYSDTGYDDPKEKDRVNGIVEAIRKDHLLPEVGEVKAEVQEDAQDIAVTESLEAESNIDDRDRVRSIIRQAREKLKNGQLVQSQVDQPADGRIDRIA